MRSGDGSDNLFHLRSRIATLVFRDANARLFAWQGERHKHSLALNARQKCAAVDRLFNCHQLSRQHSGLIARRIRYALHARIGVDAASLLAHVKQA